MSDSSHIAVLAFPFGTHAAPLFNLVRRLAASAPFLRFSFFSTSKSISSIFSGSETDDQFDNIKAYSVWDGMPDDGHALSAITYEEAIRIFLEATPENFETSMKEAEEETGEKISCFLTDAFLWFAGDFAQKRGVPWFPFWTAASCSLSTHMYTDVIQSKVGKTDPSGKAVETLEFVPGLSAIHINDLPQEIVGNSQSPLGRLLHIMGLKLPSATAVVLNSFEEIDPAITNDLKSKLQKVLNVGPLALSVAAVASSSAENECIQWLEKQNRGTVMYISFGTVGTPPPNEMVALAEALETIKIPFLWSLRDHARKLLPDEVFYRTSRQGKFVSWAPQVQVLKHSSVGAFVTHCGWNSILESISCGVPMVCRPFFGDQKLNSRMVEDVWRIGVRVGTEGFTKGGTIDALNLVLSGQRGKEIRENVKGLRDKALDAIKPNGSSTRNFEALLKMISITCPS